MKQEQVITLEDRGSFFKIVQRLPSNVMMMLGHECSYEIQGYEHIIRNQKKGSGWGRYKNWDGRKRLLHAGHRVFPSGLLPRVLDILHEYEYKVVVRERDVVPEHLNIAPGRSWPETFQPRDYQDMAVDAVLREGSGVLRIATGGGKTIIAARIIYRKQLRTLFLVHTKDLLRQAIGVFQQVFGSIGQIGDGVIDVQPITVATIQTMSRILGVTYESGDEDDRWEDAETQVQPGTAAEVRKWLETVGIVFMDECHRVAAPTAISIMAELDAPLYRIGLSASPWRDDGADLAIEACLGPVRFSMDASTLHDLGFLVAPLIRMLEVPPMAVTRSYETAYKEYIVNNEDRNRMGVNAALSMLRRGHPTLVLVRQINHGEQIQKMLSAELDAWVPFLSGRDSSDIRLQAINQMRSGRLGIMVASTIADEGLDIPPLSGLVLLGGGKSSVKALQRVGRTLRPWRTKKHAEIVDFDDRAKWFVQHSAARRRLYETEPNWIVTDI